VLSLAIDEHVEIGNGGLLAAENARRAHRNFAGTMLAHAITGAPIRLGGETKNTRAGTCAILVPKAQR
jgi:hypothetical protein